MKNQIDEGGRIAWMDMAKGIAIVLVVAYHGQLYLSKAGLAAPEYTQINYVLTLIRMPLFFSISGFLGASVVARRWPDFLKRRLIPLCYVFVLWGIIPLLYFGFVQQNIRKPSMGSDPSELLLHFFNPVSEIWFIWALIIYFLIARLATGHWRLPVFVLSVVLSALSFGAYFSGLGYVHVTALRYAAFFLGALFYGRPALAWMMTHRVPTLIGAAAAGGASLLILQLTNPGFDGPLSGPLLMLLSVCASILAGAGAAGLTRGPTMRRMGTYLGRNTLPIYVTHVIFVTIGVGLVVAFAADLPLVGYWSLPLIVVAATAAALGLAALSRKVGANWLFAMPAWFVRTKPAPVAQQGGKEAG